MRSVRSTEKRRKLQDEEKVVRSQKELCDLEKQLFDCKKAIVESRQWKGGNLMRGSTRGGGFAHSAEKLRYTFLHGRFRQLVHTKWIRYNLDWRNL